jgi:hypothetical protein
MTLNLNELSRGGTQCYSKAGLKIGTNTAAAIDTAAPNGAGIDYAINGTLYHKADTTDIAITAAAIQPVLTRCLYLVCLDSSGTLSTVKGTAKLTADLLAGNAVLEWPTPAVDTCPIGAIKVETLVAGTYTAGTTALTPGAALAVTYYDLTLVPTAPLTS